jgi:uridine kinase
MLIGLAGGRGAGKSAIAQRLVGRIGGHVIDLDSYALDRSAAGPDERSPVEDEPAAIDTALLIAHLEGLRRGDAIRKPVGSSETRASSGVEVIAPARLVLVEGLFTLWWESLRSILDLKIFVDAPADVRRRRRLRRGLADHVRTVEPVSHRSASWVRPAHERYVEPTRMFADDVVVNDGPLEDAVEQVLALVRRRRVESLAGAGQPPGR